MLVQGGIAVVGVGATVALARRQKNFDVRVVTFTSGFALTFLAVYLAVYVARRYETTTLDLGDGQSISLYKRGSKIELYHCPHFTDAHMAQLKEFPELTTLVIKDCPQLTEDGLLSLLDCEALWCLHVDCEQVTALPEAIQAHLKHNSMVSALKKLPSVGGYSQVPRLGFGYGPPFAGRLPR